MRRRNTVLVGLFLLGLFLLGLILSGCNAGQTVGSQSATAIAVGRIVRNLIPRTPAELPPSDVVMLEMFSTSSGVGIGLSHRHYYLIRTGDGGLSWSVEGTVPGYETTNGLFPSNASLIFQDPKEGYFDSGVSAVIFTDNGGRSWTRVHVPSPSDVQIEVSLYGQSLWVILNQCGGSPPSRCHVNKIWTYRFGSVSPDSSSVVPIMGGADFAQLFLLDRTGPSSGIFVEGQMTDSVIATEDDGQKWSVLDDPCSLPVMGLAILSKSHWVVYCELDGGMNQGTVAVYSSFDAGTTWKLEASANESRIDEVGHVTAAMAGDLTVSGNKEILWALGQVCCLEYSSDGGTTWNGMLGMDTGGDFVQIASAGATEAWLPTNDGLYRTTNGVTWEKLGSDLAG